jgi:hypothetical protein
MQLDQEANRLEASLANAQRSHRSEIMTKENDIRMRQAAEANLNKEDDRREITNEIRILLAQVNKHKQELQDEENSSSGAIASKRSMSQQLHGKANELEGMAGPADNV